jgi:hypothetical protein
MSACVAMILDMDYHEVYFDIHTDYYATSNEDDEYALLKNYIENKGLPINQDFADEIDEGLYLVAVPIRNPKAWHACLLSIYKGEAKLIDPRMLEGNLFLGFDKGISVSPVDIRPILKIEWSDYENFHGDKIK